MKSDRYTSRTTVAAICTGILLTLIAGVAGTRCNHGTGQETPVVIVDTVKAKLDSAAVKQKVARKRRKKQPKKPPAPPRQRDYRDETVSRP